MFVPGFVSLDDYQDYIRTKMTGRINDPLNPKETGCAMDVHNHLAQAKDYLGGLRCLLDYLSILGTGLAIHRDIQSPCSSNNFDTDHEKDLLPLQPRPA